jgi:hypothetical protein
MPLDVAAAQLGSQELLTDQRIVHDYVTGAQQLTPPNGQQARIARARADQVHDAAGSHRKYTAA